MVVGHDVFGGGADPLAHVSGGAVDGYQLVEHPQHRLVEADVHHLPLARALAVTERDERAERPERAGEIVGDGRRARAHGRTIRIPRQVGRAADGGGDAAEPRPLARGARLAERRDADHDETGIHRAQILPAETPALHRPRTEVLGEHVGRRGEAPEQRLPLRRAQVARDRLLVARLDEPPVRLSARRAPAEAPQVVAEARLLDLDHGGAELAEQGAAEGRRHEGGAIQHGETVEGLHYAGLSPAEGGFLSASSQACHSSGVCPTVTLPPLRTSGVRSSRGSASARSSRR